MTGRRMSLGGLAAVCLIAQGRYGHARRHDDGRVPTDRDGVARYRDASRDEAPLHRDGLPADARTARIPARKPLQDLHRFRWRHRIHAAVDAKRLWHPA